MKKLSLPGVLLLLASVGAAWPAPAATPLRAGAGPAQAGSSAAACAAEGLALAFPSITSQRTAKSIPPEGSCSPVPVAEATFSTTDERVYLYFVISGQASGETLTEVWYSPDGEVASSGGWDPLPAGSAYCMKGWLNVAGTSAASKPGTWRVQVYSDKWTDIPLVDLTFTIATGGGGPATFTNAMTTKSVPVGVCEPIPTAASAFVSTEAYVHLYFRVRGFQSGETLTAVWWDPSGQVHRSQGWSPLSTASSEYCLVDSLPLAGTSAASKPGSWKVQVYSDKWTDIPFVDLSFTVTSGGGAPVAGTWLLTSSARWQAPTAFWKTDLTVRNTAGTAATVTLKFLGHSGDGRGGPVRQRLFQAGETYTWRDVLWDPFGLTADYGPILVQSTQPSLAVLAQNWTPGGGGTYGQSVPVLSTSELVGATPRSILGIREDGVFRTNLMLANATESTVDVDVQLRSMSGNLLGSTRRQLGPLSRDQIDRVASVLGAPYVTDAVLVISSPTPGAAIGAYASAIDEKTQDPRTLLPR